MVRTPTTSYVDVSGTADVIGYSYLHERRHDPRRRQLDGGRDHRRGGERAGPAPLQHRHDRRRRRRRRPSASTRATTSIPTSSTWARSRATSCSAPATTGFVNTQFVDNFGRLISTGNIVMNGSTIDFGAGTNRFENDRGIITVLGRGEPDHRRGPGHDRGESIEARNDVRRQPPDDRRQRVRQLPVRRGLRASGADQLVITGDVADGSAMERHAESRPSSSAARPSSPSSRSRARTARTRR